MQTNVPPATATAARIAQPVHVTLPLKAVDAVVFGNWLEFYDFLVFTFFAVMMECNQ